ncbi:MAG: FeoA family protein [Gemmatimonadetes bacterium]|jgi:Fe2+ transport system protein FeoA|nr:FeoA family protein [Gemmatimonadota bacterium]
MLLSTDSSEENGQADDSVSLMDVAITTPVELVRIDLSPDEAGPLLDRGIVPGCLLCRIGRSPFGDPVVTADGTCFALRKETARCLRVRAVSAPEA